MDHVIAEIYRRTFNRTFLFEDAHICVSLFAMEVIKLEAKLATRPQSRPGLSAKCRELFDGLDVSDLRGIFADGTYFLNFNHTDSAYELASDDGDKHSIPNFSLFVHHKDGAAKIFALTPFFRTAVDFLTFVRFVAV